VVFVPKKIYSLILISFFLFAQALKMNLKIQAAYKREIIAELRLIQ
jgi:hypothetical protein